MLSLDLPVLANAIITIGAVLGALAIIGTWLKKWFSNRVLHILKEIETQLKPNGGSSVLDYSKAAAQSAGRVEERLQEIQIKLAELDTRDATSNIVQRELNQRISDRLDNHLRHHDGPEKYDGPVERG